MSMVLLRLSHPRAELSAYLDSQLDPAARARVERHLARCAACRQELETLRQTVALVRQLPSAEPPRSFALQPSMVRGARSTTGGASTGRPWSAFRPALAAALAAILVIVAAGGLLWPLALTGERGAAPVALAPMSREAVPAKPVAPQAPGDAPPAAERATTLRAPQPPAAPIEGPAQRPAEERAPARQADKAGAAAAAPAQAPAEEPASRMLVPAVPAAAPAPAQPAAPVAFPWPALAIALTLGALLTLAFVLWRH
jgi:hypothetical protein